MSEQDAEIRRLKSIIQLDHEVHGEDQQTITDLSRKVVLLETRTKDIALQVVRELQPGFVEVAVRAAMGK